MKTFLMNRSESFFCVVWCVAMLAVLVTVAAFLTQPITAQEEPVPPDFTEYKEFINGFMDSPSKLSYYRRAYLEAYARELGIIHANQAVNMNTR